MHAFRTIVWSVLAILLTVSLLYIWEPTVSEEASSNIYITDNSDLSSSSFVSDGNGTEDAPYLIRDWDMGTYYVRLENIVSHVQIVNLTFSSSSSWCFYLVDSENIQIQNVTVSGRGQFLFMSGCSSIRLSDCNVTSIPTQSRVVDIRNGVGITISESRFVHQEYETATIYFDGQGSGQRFLNNYLEGIPYVDDYLGPDGYILNCSFIDSPVSLEDGEFGAKISRCDFNSPGENALEFTYCYSMEVDNCTFTADNGIFFSETNWASVSDRGRIHHNVFESCDNGIATLNTYQSRPSYYDVHHNYFGNCSTYAMDLGWGLSYRIWKNIFYHNAGTDNTTAGSQCKHTNYPQSIYKTYWTVDGKGNFWANHRTPDEDNNGIVDDTYIVQTGGEDELPYTNPYFDTTPPTIEVISPTELYPDRSYLIINWDAADVGSGISSIRMRVDRGQWMDVTGKSSRSVFLDEGSHNIYFEVLDRAGMYNTTSMNYIIEDIENVVDIVSPVNGDYLSEGRVRVEWSFKEYFTPSNISLVIDGDRRYLPAEQRVLWVDLSEGAHSLMLDVLDSTGVGFPKAINFTVDLTDPDVIILSPQSGSSLSNTYIKINFQVEDNIALSGLDISIDDGAWLQRPLQETSFPVLLDEGFHEIRIRGTDMSDRSTIENVSFFIGGSPLLRFMSPMNGTSTRESEVRVEWEYTGPFMWNRSLLKVGRSGDFQDLFGQSVTNITLDTDGEYRLTLRLVDIYGNYIETSTTIIKDTEEPFVGFVNPLDSAMINNRSVRIEWRGTDNSGLPMSKYFLKIDDGPWMDMGSDLVNVVELTEGEHDLRIRAIDLAGNTGENSVEFTIDTTPPQLRFLAPSPGTILTDSFAEIFFEASDNHGLSILNLTIDSKINISVLGKNSHFTTIGTDGEHNVTLTAVDLAGNERIIRMRLKVDLTEPLVQWIRGPDVVISSSEYDLSWNVSDASGIANMVLFVGDERIDLDPDARNYTLNLTEGLHQISLEVEDLAGLSTEIFSGTGLLVDLTPPELRIDEERSKVSSNTAQLFWFSSDEGSGIGEEFVSLDGSEFDEVLSSSMFTFEGLAVGEHTVTVRVFDTAGNFRDVEWTFTIDLGSQEEDGTAQEDDSIAIWLILAAVLLVLALIIILMVVRNRRKRKREEEKRKEMAEKSRHIEKPSRLKMNIPASPASKTVAPEPAPEKPKQKVEETETGSGYIRPEKKEKKKPKKRKVRDSPERSGPYAVQKPADSVKEEEDVKEEEKELEMPSHDDSEIEHPEEVQIPAWDMQEQAVPPDETPGKVEDGSEAADPPGEGEKVSWDEDQGDEIFEELDEMEDMEELEELEDLEEMEDLEETSEWNEEELEEWG